MTHTWHLLLVARMLVGGKDASQGDKGEHKGQSDKRCNKVPCEVLGTRRKNKFFRSDWPGKASRLAAAGPREREAEQ